MRRLQNSDHVMHLGLLWTYAKVSYVSKKTSYGPVKMNLKRPCVDLTRPLIDLKRSPYGLVLQKKEHY